MSSFRARFDQKMTSSKSKQIPIRQDVRIGSTSRQSSSRKPFPRTNDFGEQKIPEYDTERTSHLTESSGQENVSSKDIRDQESLKLAHERIDELTREISQLRAEHQTSIARLQEEQRTAIVQLHAGYQATVAQLQAKHRAQAQAQAKDPEIDALKVEVMALQCQIDGILKIVM